MIKFRTVKSQNEHVYAYLFYIIGAARPYNIKLDQQDQALSVEEDPKWIL